MLTVLVNGSPKGGISGSGCVLDEVKKHLKGAECADINLRKGTVSPEEMEILKKADSIIIAFPLYVDGVPSHLLRCMEQIRDINAGVYAVCNCGFYEAEQNKHALKIMGNWCKANNLNWKRGIGIGGGGALGMIMPSSNMMFKKKVVNTLKGLAEEAMAGRGGENIYVSMGIPRAIYKMAAEKNWRKALKANGLKSSDLTRRM